MRILGFHCLGVANFHVLQSSRFGRVALSSALGPAWNRCIIMIVDSLDCLLVRAQHGDAVAFGEVVEQFQSDRKSVV